jgi:hypothetical protein
MDHSIVAASLLMVGLPRGRVRRGSQHEDGEASPEHGRRWVGFVLIAILLLLGALLEWVSSGRPWGLSRTRPRGSFWQ